MTGRKLASVVDDGAALAGFSRASVSMVLSDARAEDQPIVYVNQAFERTTGYTRSAAIGRNCRFLQGEATDKAQVDRLRAAIESREDVAVDIVNYRADGRPFVNRLIVAPITDASGDTIYFLGIQKEVEGDDRDSAEALDALLPKLHARLRHDIDLVLGPSPIADAPDRQEAFEAMRRRLECLQFVYEGMTLSAGADRADPGRRGVWLDLGSILSRVAGAVAHEEGRPGIRYTQTIEAMDVTLDAGVRIAMLCSEIVSNAFLHAFDRIDEGVVDMRMSRLAAGGLRMTVSDDGLGLPAGRPFPDPDTVGGRLVGALAEGLEATITPVRGAAGTVLVVDVPAGIVEE